MLERWNGDPNVASAVLTAGFVDYPVPQTETPEDIARQISDGYISRDESWIATRGGTATGGIFGAARADKRARIHSMAVAPEFRRCGAGRHLLAAFLNGMDAAGVGAVHLEVIETNVAARFLYESAGFTPSRHLRCLRNGRMGVNCEPSSRQFQPVPPEGDHLGVALVELGWSSYTRQIDMIRRV